MAGYIGQAPANKFLTLDKQTFTTSATDTYSLDKTVSSANEIELFLNNVRQEPIEAYTVSGNTLTLASAITSSDTMYCIYQGKAIGSISPATNSVSNDMLVNSSLSVNGTSISLGASGTISAGITAGKTLNPAATLVFVPRLDDPNEIPENLEYCVLPLNTAPPFAGTNLGLETISTHPHLSVNGKFKITGFEIANTASAPVADSAAATADSALRLRKPTTASSWDSFDDFYVLMKDV